MTLRIKFAAFMLACVSWSVHSALAATEAVLKNNVVVEDRMVTLGDLFTPESFIDNPEGARVVISASPRPGEHLVLDAYRISKFSAEHGVDWPNAQKLTTVSVERAGDIIAPETIKAQLLDAAAAQGMQGHLALSFSGAMPTLNIPVGAEASVAVDALDIDERSGQFRARLRAPANDSSAQPVPMVGRIYPVTELPVLTHDMHPGDVVNKGDFEWTEVASDRLGQNVLTDTSELVGTTPKRMLRAGQPIRIGDVAPPIVINKGDLVAMTVDAPGMSLTAQGRALDAGGQGDTIRIMNSLSKRTVEGTIKGPGRVVVGSLSDPATIAAR